MSLCRYATAVFIIAAACATAHEGSTAGAPLNCHQGKEPEVDDASLLQVVLSGRGTDQSSSVSSAGSKRLQPQDAGRSEAVTKGWAKLRRLEVQSSSTISRTIASVASSGSGTATAIIVALVVILFFGVAMLICGSGDTHELTPTAPGRTVDGDSTGEPITLTLDDALGRIYDKGNGNWLTICTVINCLAPLVLAIEANMTPFLVSCVTDLGTFTPGQQASLNAAGGMGGLLGTFVLFPLADSFGRWRVLSLSIAVSGFFGILSAAATSYWYLFFARFLTGVFGSVWLLAIDLTEEYAPPERRGVLGNVGNVGWGLGAFAVILLAWWSLPLYGWRGFTAMAGAPYCLMSVVIGLYLVESPRWLLAQGRHDEAMEVLRYIASKDGCAPPCNQLQAVGSNETQENQDTPSVLQGIWRALTAAFNLLASENRCMTLAIWGIWMGWSFAYLGVVVFDTVSTASSSESNTCQFNYPRTAGLATSEIIVPLLVFPFIDRNDLGWFGGRLGMQAIPYLVAAMAAFFVGMHVSSVFFWAWLTRGLIAAGSGTSVVHTPELYDTNERATGTGAASIAGTLGGIMAPYFVYGGTPMSSSLAVAGSLVLCTTLVLGMPETAQVLLDKGDEDPRITGILKQ